MPHHRENYVFGRSTLQGGGVTINDVKNEIIESSDPDLAVSIVTPLTSTAPFSLIPPATITAQGLLLGTNIPFDTADIDTGNRLVDGTISSTIPKFWDNAIPATSNLKTSIRVDDKPFFAGKHLYDFSAAIYIDASETAGGAYLFEIAATVYTITGIFVLRLPIWNGLAIPAPMMKTTISIAQNNFVFDLPKLLSEISAQFKIPVHLMTVWINIAFIHTNSSSVEMNSAKLSFRRHRTKL